MKKIDKKERQKIKAYIENKIANLDNPKSQGKALKGSHSGLWRYRVGNYRIICDVDNETITILVVRIGHRKEIYNPPHK